MLKDYDISLPVRINILHQANDLCEYLDEGNFAVKKKKNKLKKDIREAVLLNETYSLKQ